MKDLVDTTEMYLRTIYELGEEEISPLRARIVERLDQSGPTVSQTVNRMERDGLVHVATDRTLKLTDMGYRTAVAVMRKHRLAEQLLYTKIGLDILKVHGEACRWEHVISLDVERRLVQVLDEFRYSPFGNPIPGLEELGVTPVSTPDIGRRLSDLPAEIEVPCRIVQFHELLQVQSALMKELYEANIWIDCEVTAFTHEGEALLRKDSKTVVIPKDLAHALRVDTGRISAPQGNGF